MNLVPTRPELVIIEPLSGDGVTPGGVWLPNDSRLPTVFARVLAVHPEQSGIEPGDIVVHRANSPDDVPGQAGKVQIVHESDITAILEGYTYVSQPEIAPYTAH
jgi:co-chaperonin GroES (HSP10)